MESSCGRERKFYETHRDQMCPVFQMDVLDIAEGYAKVGMAVSERSRNPIGTVHGGALFSIADNAGGIACNSFGQRCTTVNCSFDYLRPGLDAAYVTAEARIIKHGKNLSVASVSLKDQNGKELAVGTFTYMSLKRSVPWLETETD